MRLINKFSVFICFAISVILLVKATMLYPGGSVLDPHSAGFQWSKNFLSNLFAAKGVNGLDNPGRIWAVTGMVFQSIGYGLFFIHMSKKIASTVWSKILRFIGIANFLLIFLIATPWHDVGTFSIVLTLLGLFAITVFIFKSKLRLLKLSCIVCLLTYYVFFFFYGMGYLSQAVILQKVYTICSLLLVLALEYFTSKEDFTLTKPAVQKTGVSKD